MPEDIVLLLLLATALIGMGIGVGMGVGVFLRRPRAQAPGEFAVVETTLDRLGRRLDEAEALRRADQASLRAELNEHLRHVATTTDILRRETGSLAAALGRVEVRGRWGEAQLRRLVEAAGMLERVHFVEQSVQPGEHGVLRPDMVIDLGAGRRLVVDAKVPLAALLEAESTDDPATRAPLMVQHARDVAAHAERLGSKDYWRAYDDSLDMVVMFMPAESMLGIALREDPALLERAFGRNVVIATPTTFLALLRTLGHVWRREAALANAAEIHQLGRELHERLRIVAEHLRKTGAALDGAVAQYNRLVGSWDSRVAVSARRLAETGVASAELPDVASVERRAGASLS